MTSKIAAVTGATGFVGRHLVRELLAQGFHVQALTRRPISKNEPETDHITWIEGDLEKPEALGQLVDKADIVFHLAGLIKAKNKADFNRINSQTVQNLLAQISQSSHKPHFILLSSLAARERYLSPYAESKRRGEEILMEYGADFPWTILRPPGIYGPEDMETLKIFKAVTAGFAPLPGGQHNKASWIYAPDLARAMIAVCGVQDCFGQILDVDDGKENGYSHQEMYDTASDILRIKPFYFIIPRPALKLVAYFNVLFSTFFGYTPMLTPEKVNELCYPDWLCRGLHVMKITKWRPQTDLKQGFKETLKWYKDNKLM